MPIISPQDRPSFKWKWTSCACESCVFDRNNLCIVDLAVLVVPENGDCSS